MEKDAEKDDCDQQKACGAPVVYFDQRLGAAHSKRWLK